MKKSLSILIPAVLAASILFSCASTPVENSDDNQDITPVENYTEDVEIQNETENPENSQNNNFIQVEETENVTPEEELISDTDIPFYLSDEPDHEEDISENLHEKQGRIITVIQPSSENISSDTTENQQKDDNNEMSAESLSSSELNFPEKEEDIVTPSQLRTDVSEETSIAAKEKAINNTESKADVVQTEMQTASEPEISSIKETDIQGTEEKAEEVQPSSVVNNQAIVPSRSVTMENNQFLDISYPGSGWIYLGETDNNNLMRYFGRKISNTNTSFTLRSTAEGTTILHFYKNDPLTDSFIDDYLAVTVSGKNTGKARINAPAYGELVPERFENFEATQEQAQQKVAERQAQMMQENQENNTDLLSENNDAGLKKSSSTVNDSEQAQTVNQSSSSVSKSKKGSPTPTVQDEESDVSTVVQTTEPQQQVQQTLSRETNGSNSDSPTQISQQTVTEEQSLSPDQYLQLAKDSYNTKHYQEALDYLELFFENAVTDLDEGLFLQGQILESPSTARNIKGALEAYELLVKSYPQSKRWKEANDRIIYINRFYFGRR